MGSSKGPAFRENIHRLFDEAQAAELAPGIVSLIESRATRAQIREIGIDKILPNPAQPRLSYEEDSLTEPAHPAFANTACCSRSWCARWATSSS